MTVGLVLFLMLSFIGVRPTFAADQNDPLSAEPTSEPSEQPSPTPTPTPSPTPVDPVWVPPKLVPTYNTVLQDKPAVGRNGCHVGHKRTKAKACTYGKNKKAPRVLLFGDSHTAHWFGPFKRLADRGAIRLTSVTKSWCAAVDYRLKPAAKWIMQNCNRWRSDVFKNIRKEKWGKLDLVVLSPFLLDEASSRLEKSAWKAGYLRTLRVVTKHSKRVLVLRDTPFLPASKNLEKCILNHKDEAKQKCGAPASQALRPSSWAAATSVGSRSKKVRNIDLTRYYCPTGYCSPIAGNRLMLRDSHHATNSFMTAVMHAPLVREMSKQLRYVKRVRR